MWEYLVGLFALLRALTGIRFFLIKRKVKGPIDTFENAKPIFKKVKGNKVALLIHGFTASPREVKDLANYLVKNGISVYAPLLPGHGTSPERLAVIRHYQWIESVRESIDLLSKDYKEIYLIGSSFGGNLALISSNYLPSIKGIVTIGTPIVFRKHKINKFLLLILRRIKLFQKKPKRVRDFIETHNGSYKVIPLRAAYEMSKIVELSKNEVSYVTKPILVIHVKNDNVVSEESHKYILKNIMSKEKSEFMVKDTNHVALLGKDASIVNKKILDFIK